MRRKPTYDELLGIVKKDFPHALPSRSAMDILNSFEMSALRQNFEELDEIHRNRAQQEAFRQQAQRQGADAGMSHREARENFQIYSDSEDDDMGLGGSSGARAQAAADLREHVRRAQDAARAQAEAELAAQVHRQAQADQLNAFRQAAGGTDRPDKDN